MNELIKFYQSLLQEVTTRQLANEDGDTQEQSFTRYVLDLLSDAGETENATVAFDEKALGTKNQHKINGYAIADNYETIDLFISIYNSQEENIHTTYTEEINRAATRILNFFRKGIYGDYANEIEESSEIFEFVNTLTSFKELRDSLVRVNAIILTNGEYKGEIPKTAEVSGYKVFYRVIDIHYLFQISEASRMPIEINFSDEGYEIPCLVASSDNPDYQAYIAIMPGACLAELYERFGSRLLEQNVRSFLQFSGKINAGIRKTIISEPHMFMAFNNGLAVTADNVELDPTGRYICKISNLQIVNGGQTTASIYHASKKDKADISNIYVQAKISVIKRAEEYSDIVSRISRYANTQNKVNNADFTASNPYLVAFEKLSRFIMTPLTDESNVQTYWFFERARGQYKNLRMKEGFTKSRRTAFDLKYPKRQVITKVELAKYVNAYGEVYDGKKLVIGPHIVVRGNEKNYAKFINDNLPESTKKLNNVYFEDAIAKAILFRTADKRYGTKASGNSIGELKQVVVPYAISLLNIITIGKLDLYRIWKNQRLSDTLSDFIYDLMKQINAYILKESPISHYIEWAKKDVCWEQVKKHVWSYDLNEIKSDLINENAPARRVINIGNDNEDEDREHDMEIINSITHSLWEKFAEWGRDTECLSINYQNNARDIAHNLKFHHRINDSLRHSAIAIYDIVCEKNMDLLLEADEMALKDQKEADQKRNDTAAYDYNVITVELVQKMVEWDRRRRILKDWQWKVMDDVVKGRKKLDDRLKKGIYQNYLRLKKNGFSE